ncbi:MAG: hypothetical protein ACK5GD_08005 [Planctomycetota bacterium]
MSKTYRNLALSLAAATLGQLSPCQTACAQPPGMSFGPGGPGMVIMGGGGDRVPRRSRGSLYGVTGVSARRLAAGRILT